MLFVQNFSKNYSGTTVISAINLEFNTGVYWIKGENGSGKTTFFKCLSGVIPCHGTIKFDDGISLKTDPIEYRKRVNYSEAEPLYPGFLTPKELIRFIGRTKAAPPEQQDYFLKNFGIDQYQDKPCSTCSSGMLKKLSLVLAFLGTPKVIILDEPLITLDSDARNILLAFINQYTTQHQTIFLLSSHQTLEDHAVHLNDVLTIQHKIIQKV
ncbi:MAG: ABC transporter [Marivirga sp.]|nr:ABC transporter [Marivirga sp.]